MKSVITMFAGLVLLSQTAFADVQIIKSQLEGIAITLPNGVLQIMNPRIKFGNKLYALEDTELNLPITADTACEMLSRKWVNVDSEFLKNEKSVAGVISFGESGKMNLTRADKIAERKAKYPTENGLLIISLLTCE